MEWLKLVLLVLTSCCMVYFTIPTLIKIARKGNFYDEPDHIRKIHTTNIPNLGGVAIFFGFLFTCVIFVKMTSIEFSNFLLGGYMLIFFIGVRDDLVGLSAYKKIGLQVLAAFLVVVFANVRITSFYGLFGVGDLPEWFSVLFSIFTIIVITNSFNLIDGIDGLAANLGVVVSLCLGVIFLMMNETGWCRISLALCGALIGFIPFNFSPAKIFMGDTGAYTIGFILSVLAIQFIELNKFNSTENPLPFIKSSPAIGIAILFVPLFDTLRVFIMRILKGQSPFYADRNHIHHILLDKNWSHRKISITLALSNLVLIGVCIYFQEIGSIGMMIFIMLLSILLHIVLHRAKKRPQVKLA